MDSPVEILIVIAVAAILLGPSRIPKLARSLGEAMHEFRTASNDGTSESAEPPSADSPELDPISQPRPGTGTELPLADPVPDLEGG